MIESGFGDIICSVAMDGCWRGWLGGGLGIGVWGSAYYIMEWHLRIWVMFTPF